MTGDKYIMKKYFIITLIFFVISPLPLVHADTKTITINWNVSGSIDAIQTYKMIYSYSNDMANPIDACQTNNNTLNSLTCEDVEITSEDVYFRIAAITNQKTIVYSNIEHLLIPLINTVSTVQGFNIVSNDPPPDPEPSANIFDDFSMDTSANYSFISGSMYIENGKAHGQSWRRSIGYHTTSLGKPDQKVSATCSFSDNDYSSVAARVNPSDQTGYFVTIGTGDLTLRSFSGSSSSWITETSHSFSSPVQIELSVTGNNIVVKVNNNVLINTTDDTYSTGNFCGLVMGRGFSNADITLDDFEGAAQ